MYSWTASGSVWYRHFLRHNGVPPESLRWSIGDIDGPTATPHGAPFPPGVELAPPGRTLAVMLIRGEIDALLSPPRPRRYHPVDGPIVRLVPDIRAAERDYYRATGCFPPQHLVILRRAVWALNPWIARSLTDAFQRCHDHFAGAQRRFPYASPWLDLDIEEADALMGAGFRPHGLDDHTRREIEAFCDQAHRAGLTGRRVGVDECFEEFLSS
jgi:4,5-dihydroxyphthalate decarboxylase